MSSEEHRDDRQREGESNAADPAFVAAVEHVASAIGEALGAALAETRRRHPSLERSMAMLCLSALDTVSVYQLAHAAADEAARFGIEKPDALAALLRQHIRGVTKGSFAILALHEAQAHRATDTPSEEPAHVVH